MGGSVLRAEGGTVPPTPGSTLMVVGGAGVWALSSTWDRAWCSQTGPGAGPRSGAGRGGVEPGGGAGLAGTGLDRAGLGTPASPPGGSSGTKGFLSRPWFLLPSLRRAVGSRAHRSRPRPRPGSRGEGRGEAGALPAAKGCEEVARVAGPRPRRRGHWPVTGVRRSPRGRGLDVEQRARGRAGAPIASGRDGQSGASPDQAGWASPRSEVRIPVPRRLGPLRAALCTRRCLSLH